MPNLRPLILESQIIDKEYSSSVALMIKDNSKVDDSADRLSFAVTRFVANSILPDLTQKKENDYYLPSIAKLT
ncbi:hypothetical protein GCS34_11930 [Salmonella enterica]|nr:hypothetical protein [Salmonella enterica]